MELLMIQMQQRSYKVEEYVYQYPTGLNVALGAAYGFVMAIVMFFLFICIFQRTKSSTILLTGLGGRGKTFLFYKLRDGSAHQGTVTSMRPNEDNFVLHTETYKKGKTRPVRVADVPGHSHLRPKLDKFLPRAAAIVFLVDSEKFLPNSRPTAEYLYEILTKATVVKKKIPVLLLCNKVDKTTAHTKEFIRKQLEKEIGKLRTSRTAVSEADISIEFTLGVPGEPFVFSQCCNKVIVAEASGLPGEISDQLEQFIRENVRPRLNR